MRVGINAKKKSVVTDVHQVPDPRIADLVQAGRVRVALYPPQYMKDPVTGELRDWTIELAGAFRRVTRQTTRQ